MDFTTAADMVLKYADDKYKYAIFRHDELWTLEETKEQAIQRAISETNGYNEKEHEYFNFTVKEIIKTKNSYTIGNHKREYTSISTIRIKELKNV